MRAFASVPREQFVGPGPWQILRLEELSRGYATTPDADPRHVYDNVLVALDPSRSLNNGEPAALARWLDCLDPAPGCRFLHLGCGVGYYTAIVAEAMKPGGTVVGVEIDRRLAERARENLRGWDNASVVEGDASDAPLGPFDRILVNAGATEPLPGWLDALPVHGRLLLPLTVDGPGPNLGVGYMLSIERCAGTYSAGFVSPVGVFHCAGARTREGSESLRRSFRDGGHDGVRSLRRDAHDLGPDCWLHTPRFCLSRQAIDD